MPKIETGLAVGSDPSEMQHPEIAPLKYSHSHQHEHQNKAKAVGFCQRSPLLSHSAAVLRATYCNNYARTGIYVRWGGRFNYELYEL